MAYQNISETTSINPPEVPDLTQDVTAYQALDRQRVADAMMMLGNATHDLNDVSDGMRASVDKINAAIKKLAPGVAAWLTYSKGESDRALGYAKVNGAWCIALRESSGDRAAGTYREYVWNFNEASRWMRVESAGKIPDLLDALLERVRDMTEKLRKKSEFVKSLSVAIIDAQLEGKSKYDPESDDYVGHAKAIQDFADS